MSFPRSPVPPDVLLPASPVLGVRVVDLVGGLALAVALRARLLVLHLARTPLVGRVRRPAERTKSSKPPQPHPREPSVVFSFEHLSETRAEDGHLMGLARVPVKIVLMILVEEGLSAPVPLRAPAPDHNQDQNETNL